MLIPNRKRSIDETLTLSDGQYIHQLFHQLSVEKLDEICQHYIPHPHSKSRTWLYVLISRASSPVQEQIRQAVINGPQTHANTAVAALGNDISNDQGFNDLLCQSGFMRSPSKEVVDAAISEFIDRTGNAALAAGICAICARETKGTELTVTRLDHFPNPHCLSPNVPHPNHDLFYGMLLHPPGLLNDGTGNACTECLRALKSDKLPKYALANGMWIGRTPHELSFLTLPERILIAKFFPAAYIIKLYPKKKGARHWDNRQMYSGLRGNVSTYQLDQAQIASMIDGSILPQTAKVLAATIGITFVGPRNLPEKCMPEMFRVRRTRVKKALEWLKEHNPLFADITISASRLAELPEDDIPYELTSTAKLSTNVNMLYAEQDGYVPSQEAGDDGSEEGKSIRHS
jgi:hypothetical protein